MNQLNCLNLCDMIHHLYESTPDLGKIIDKANEVAGFEKCERIYIGSYFCSQYFLHQSEEILGQLKAVCKEQQIPISLVIPTFSQKDLERGKQKIEQIKHSLELLVDELVVNDYGMLTYVKETYKLPIYLGRLFAKDYRDPRYENYFNEVLKPKIFNHYMLELIKDFEVKGLELDPTHIGVDLREAPSWLTIGMHGPYCYMTTGHICEYASLDKPIEKKFRPNNPCAHECTSHVIRYDLEDEREWLRLGKTIYFENRECTTYEIDHIRNIYFPIDLEVGR